MHFESSSKRVDNIDMLKGICAFLIVCIHTPFPGVFGEYFTALSRIAVPIFFMITGFFYSNVVVKCQQKKQIKNIFMLVLSSNLFYFLFNGAISIVSGVGFNNYLNRTFKLKNIIKFIFLNESPFGGHLWYLGAILYVLIITFILDKYKIRKVMYYITPLLLAGDLVLGKYSLLFFRKEFSTLLVRNFLFVGIPYFTIGIMLYQHREYIQKKLKKSLLLGFIILFAILNIIERFVLIQGGINATRDQYIFTIFLSLAVFTFLMKIKLNQSNVMMCFVRSGKDFSTWIYILHPCIISLYIVILKSINLYEVFQYILPLIVYLTAIAVTMLGNRFNRLFSLRLLNIMKKYNN